MKDKIVIFGWLAFMSKIWFAPSQLQLHGIVHCLGCLARALDAVCIAPAAAAATWLAMSRPRAAAAAAVLGVTAAALPARPHRHLPVNHGGGGARERRRGMERARDLQGSGLRRAVRASASPGSRLRRARDPLEKAEVERRLAHLAGEGTGPRRGTGSGGRDLGDAELAWQSEITTGGCASERSAGGGR